MKSIFLIILLAFTLSLNLPVYAGPATISKQQAVNIAQKVNPGRVLSVKLKGATYKVKTLSRNGEVRVISIDANNGKVKGH